MTENIGHTARKFVIATVIGVVLGIVLGLVLVHSRTSKFVTADGRPNYTAIERSLHSDEP